jgi:hypothetical protein
VGSSPDNDRTVQHRYSLPAAPSAEPQPALAPESVSADRTTLLQSGSVDALEGITLEALVAHSSG